MSPNIVPVQLNEVRTDRKTYTDYSGTGGSKYIPKAELLILTRQEKREVKLRDYPWLKNQYEDVTNVVVGREIAAILDDNGEFVVFRDTKEELMNFEEEKL